MVLIWFSSGTFELDMWCVVLLIMFRRHVFTLLHRLTSVHLAHPSEKPCKSCVGQYYTWYTFFAHFSHIFRPDLFLTLIRIASAFLVVSSSEVYIAFGYNYLVFIPRHNKVVPAVSIACKNHVSPEVSQALSCVHPPSFPIQADLYPHKPSEAPPSREPPIRRLAQSTYRPSSNTATSS